MTDYSIFEGECKTIVDIVISAKSATSDPAVQCSIATVSSVRYANSILTFEEATAAYVVNQPRTSESKYTTSNSLAKYNTSSNNL